MCIWTPDKDETEIRKKFGMSPILIPDFLALVGDSADDYPGISGIGKTGAAQLLSQYGPIEAFPDKVLGKNVNTPCCSNAWPLYEPM